MDQIGFDQTSPISQDIESMDTKLTFPFPLPILKQTEESLVKEAMRRVHGNQSAAARMLGVSRQTISRYVTQG